MATAESRKTDEVKKLLKKLVKKGKDETDEERARRILGPDYRAIEPLPATVIPDNVRDTDATDYIRKLQAQDYFYRLREAGLTEDQPDLDKAPLDVEKAFFKEQKRQKKAGKRKGIQLSFEKLARQAMEAVKPKKGTRKARKGTEPMRFSSGETASILDSILTNGANMIVSNKFLSMLAGFFAIEMVKYIKPCDHGWQDVMILLQGIGITGYLNSELEGEMEVIITALGMGGAGIAAALGGVRPECSKEEKKGMGFDEVLKYTPGGVVAEAQHYLADPVRHKVPYIEE